jgi:hypothetical protein
MHAATTKPSLGIFNYTARRMKAKADARTLLELHEEQLADLEKEKIELDSKIDDELLRSDDAVKYVDEKQTQLLEKCQDDCRALMEKLFEDRGKAVALMESEGVLNRHVTDMVEDEEEFLRKLREWSDLNPSERMVVFG